MPIFRRRKVSCFYCGEPSSPDDSAEYHPNGRVSCFICPHCNADNHLDPRGEVVDYVPEAPPNATLQYAHRRAPSHATRPSTLNSGNPSQTFCRTCQHNQMIVHNAKSSYPMPPEDNPDHEYHMNVKYPQYVKDLEVRWPQVCSDCLPKVKEKLRQVNYDVKVKSLGHMLARTEQPVVKKKPFALLEAGKWIFWCLRGTVWAWANLLFLGWHLAAVLKPEGSTDMERPSWTQCVRGSVDRMELDAACYDVSFQQASHYFPLTLLGFFWVYRQWGQERHPDKKLVGGKEYLQVEVVAVLLRFLGWLLLGERGWMLSMDPALIQQAHLMFLVLSTVAFLFSITCLRLEDPPTFSLRETGPPSPLKARSGSPQRSISPQRSPLRNKQISRTPQLNKPASMTRMSPQRPLSLTKTPPLRPINYNQPIPPITPTYRDNNAGVLRSPSPSPQKPFDQDEMDWDPISPDPLPEIINPWNIRDPSSSFAGSSRPTPRLAAPNFSTPSSVFASPIKSATPSQQWARSSADSPFRYTPLAQPKFLPPPDTLTDTGLEGLFDGGLRLADELDSATPVDVGERETIQEPLGRLGMLVLSAAIAAVAPEGYRILALPVVVSAALWRMVKGERWWSGAEVLGSVAAGAACSERVGIAVVVAALTGETWRFMLRMQRERKREFWKEERHRVEEVEKKEQMERAGSGSPAGLAGMGFRSANTKTAMAKGKAGRASTNSGGLGGLGSSFAAF